jgi:hypothetical protein
MTATGTATTMANAVLTVVFGENGARGHLALTTAVETELEQENAVVKIKPPAQAHTKNEKSARTVAPKF